ncbi:hypothetical protein YC2023_019494 [Brassica napus]
MNLSGLHKEMDAFKFGFALTLSQARISWHALDLCSPAPATLFLAGAGHYRRPCSLQLSSSSVSTLFVVLFGFVTFKSLKEAVSDGSLTGDKRLGSSSSLSFWRYSLLGGFSLQRRVERVLSPSLLSGSRVQIPVILSLATDGKVSTLILSALVNRSWNIDLNVQTPPFRLREVLFTFLAFYLDTTPPPLHVLFSLVALSTSGETFPVTSSMVPAFISLSPFSSLSRPKVMDEAELVQLFMVLTAWVALSEFSDEFTGISRACLWSYPSSENCLLMGSSDLVLGLPSLSSEKHRSRLASFILEKLMCLVYGSVHGTSSA